MAYDVELSESAERELGKLDSSQSKRILKFLHQRVAKLDDPRSLGEALPLNQFSGIELVNLGVTGLQQWLPRRCFK